MKNLLTLFLMLLAGKAFNQNPHDTLYSPDITRLSNYGNCERRLELTDYSRQFIVDNYFMPNTIYKGKNSPIQVSVYDWNNVIPGDYRLDFDSISRFTTWKLYRVGTNDTVYSSNDISILNHQYIPQWGLVVTVYEDTIEYSYAMGPHVYQEPDTSYFDYSGTNCQWVSGMEDIDNHPFQNWILEGTDSLDYYSDSLEPYEKILNGRFSTGKLAAFYQSTSPFDSAYANLPGFILYQNLGSIDIVMTADTSLWTRCSVVNTDQNGSQNVQEILNFPSLNKLGLPDNSGTIGMSWFPGYAIDVEYGERLNLAFGENPSLTNHNGNDGIFNPDSVRYESGIPVFGGQHWVYIFHNQDRFYPGVDRMPRYDEGNYLNSHLQGTNADKLRAWRSITWMGSIQPEQGYDFLDCDVKLKIRTKYSNIRHQTGITPSNDTARYQFTIPNSIPNSIHEISKNELNVFPNPSESGIFYIKNNSVTKMNYYEIFDLTGKLLNSEMISTNEFVLNLNHFSSGLYLLSVYDENKFRKTFKLVIE